MRKSPTEGGTLNACTELVSMQTAQLVKRNLAYYWRTNLPVVFGVAIAVAVLAGALLVGDSVRASLRDLFLQRLGKTDFVISATGFFREQLASDIEKQPDFARSGFAAACPLIELEGSVSEANGARAGGVRVYGVDERFWKFHGREGKQPPQNREVFLSDSLARELNTHLGDSILLRIEKPSNVPRESLYGRKEDLGRTLRLTIKEIISAEDLGEFSTRPQQTAVRALFVPLKLLQKELEKSYQVNTILISKQSVTNAGVEGQAGIEKILRRTASLADYDVRLRLVSNQKSISLERGSTLVDDSLAEKARAVASASSMRTSTIFAYVANSISSGGRAVPYSLVTALDEPTFHSLLKGSESPAPQGEPAANVKRPAQPPIVLNEWAARELNARAGDQISLEYYVWQEDGHLETRTAAFQLVAVVPITGLAADRNLIPDYPGISESDSMSDWDPPFPVDLGRIRKQDEDYWKQYRTTPKAFITLEVGQDLWKSRFGRITSMRLTPAGNANAVVDRYAGQLASTLDPASMGLVILPARAQGLAASRGATDFGEYFLYFSFFLVVSALLLTALFFKLGIEQRLREIGIMQAIGFPAARIRSLFVLEGTLLAVAGSLIGLAGAVAYGQFMMFGLRTWWVGAVGTTTLRLHPSLWSLVTGGVGGVIAALVCVWWTLRRLKQSSTRSLLMGTSGVGDTITQKRRRGDAETRKNRGGLFSSVRVGFSFAVLTLLLLAAASFHLLGQTAGFFGGGTACLIALLCFQSVWLRRARRNSIHGNSWLSVLRLGFRNATYRPGRSVLCIALIASATFIIVAVDAFRRETNSVALDRKSGSGGFPLLAESLLPLIHDPNSREGREALNLAGDQNAAVLAGAGITRFRLHPGDDASCLNLYQPHSPRILAATEQFIRSNRFAFQTSIPGNREETDNPWLLLNRELGNGVVPVIADSNSLTYVLHLKMGDEFVLNRSEGPVRLRIVGALADSIFQSELIMAEKNFLKLFPQEQGYRFFLIDAPEKDQAAISLALEDRLADFGFDVVPTAERLANFHRVENTYLSTFQMLGGLGLLLGTLGMAAVLLRNVLERRKELALLRAVGYNSSHFTIMVIAENVLLLLSGLATGSFAAALAIAPIFLARGGQLPNASLGFLLLLVLISGLVATVAATWAALCSPLLASLRAE
ncbi:MAG: FtsX-like permease family protein [Acidobacteria bacterium]|nr:FtsX-like permease family protein [Acidobacteriota bacterium]